MREPLLGAMLGSKALAPMVREAVLRDFLEIAPDRLEPLLDGLLDPKSITPSLCELIMGKGADRYGPAVADAWRKVKNPSDRFEIGAILMRHDPERYGREMLEVARAVFADENEQSHHAGAGIWMLQTYGAEALGEIVAYLERTAESTTAPNPYNRTRIMSAAVQALGPQAIPAVLAALRTVDTGIHLMSLSHLIDLDDGSHDAVIRSELARGLAESGELQSYTDPSGFRPSDHIASYIKLTAHWKPTLLADRLWELLGHKSKPVREAAAWALSRLGAEVVPRAAGLLQDRKADQRSCRGVPAHHGRHRSGATSPRGASR